MTGRLLVVQPSNDYAHRIRRSVPDAVFLATPERAHLLSAHPHVIPADLGDIPTTVETLKAWAKKNDAAFAGITTFICEAMAETAALAHSLGLRFHADALVLRTRDKHRAQSAWRRENVPTPTTRKIRDLNDLLDFTAQIDGPWILKPAGGSGSAWVLRVEDHEDLADAHARIAAGLNDEPYLAQQCISGREFSADLYVDRGDVRVLRLTEKYLLPCQGRAGLVGAYYPAQIEPTVFAAMCDTFRRGTMALGIKHGIAMVDAIWSHGKLYLLEMALRPGGDCLPDLCVRATGYDPIRTACEVALGQTPTPSDIAHPAPVAALHLIADRSGRIRRINFDRLKAHPVVLHVEPYRAKGDELRCWAGSYDDSILAACVVQCADSDDLPVLVELLTKRIDLQLET